MFNFKQFISICSVIAGAILTLLGLGSIGVYVYSVIQVMDQADRSIIFWYFILVIIGFFLIGVGIYFVIIGFRAYRGKKSDARLVTYSLGVLGTVLIVLILAGLYNEKITEQQRAERLEQDQIIEHLQAEMHRIEQVKIEQFNENSFTFRISVSEGLEGDYVLHLKIYNSQAAFLEESKEITIDSGSTQIKRQVSFEQLFSKCADEYSDSNIYVCIENTGAKSFFTIESELTLIKDKENTISEIDDLAAILKSLGETEFALDTFTKNRTVQVNNFQPLDH